MFVDYMNWHFSFSDFHTGSGISQNITYNEISYFWSDAGYFVPYESYLYRLCKSGFEIQCLFAVNYGELYGVNNRNLFQKVFMRN